MVEGIWEQQGLTELQETGEKSDSNSGDSWGSMDHELYGSVLEGYIIAAGQSQRIGRIGFCGGMMTNTAQGLNFGHDIRRSREVPYLGPCPWDLALSSATCVYLLPARTRFTTNLGAVVVGGFGHYQSLSAPLLL